MSVYLSDNLLGYSFRQMEAVDVLGATPPPAQPKITEGEQTAAQLVSPAMRWANGHGIPLSYCGVLGGSQAYGGLDAVPILPGTYATYREMSKDATLALGIAAANAPVKACKWAWRERKDAPAGALNLIRDMIDPMRSHIVDEMLKSREFGWRGFEKVFTDAGATLKRLKPLIPELTTIRYFQQTGRFAGFRNNAYGAKQTDNRGGVTLDLEYSLLYTHDIEGDDYHGNPLHENSRRAFSYWLHSTGNRFRAQRKTSGVIVQIHYPPGKTEVGGVLTDNADIAQQILEQIGLTNSLCIPNDWAREDRGYGQPTSDKPQWQMSVLNAGENGEALKAIAEDSLYWDTLKLRGWLVPERAVTEGKFGTKAEAGAHADILINVAEEEAGEIVRTVNWHVIDQLLAVHYGEKARGSVYIEPQPLSDDTKDDIMQVLVAMLSDPGIRTDVRRQTEMKTALAKVGMPVQEEVDIDDEEPTVIEPKPPATPPVNGNGKMNGNGNLALDRLAQLIDPES